MAPKLSLAAVVLTLLAVPASAAANTRYATPNPDSTHDCSQAHPCDIVMAITAPGGNDDEVIVLPGTYDISANGLSTQDRMNVHGLDGAPRPVINNTSSIGLAAIGSGSTVRYLKVTTPGTAGGAALDVQNGSTAENVIAEGLATNNPNGCQTEGGAAATATIRDSVCEADGNGAAVESSDFSGNFNTTTLRNVTAISSAGSGIVAVTSQNKTVQVNVVNSIVKGGTTDVQAAHSGTGDANVNLSYSNFSSMIPPTGTGTGIAIVDQGHNQSAAPLLTSDFHEQPGSPTIDAGVNDPANGSTDFDGDPRSLGSGVTDIGADEFVPAPLVTTNDPTGVGTTGATLNGSVNPESRDTTYHFELGTTTAYGQSTPSQGAGSGVAPVGVSAAVGGLAPGTTYHYRLVATSSSGTSFGQDKQLTTAGTPLLSLPPPFAGLTLVHQTVTMDRSGRVSLDVTCPATAVGNCVGTDTLTTAGKVTVKLVATASRTKKPKILKLGSAHFSIPPGTKLKLKIKLSKQARKLLARKKTLKAVETVVAHDSRNVSKTTKTNVTLKAPKAKKRRHH